MSREGKVGQSAAGPGRGSAGPGRAGQCSLPVWEQHGAAPAEQPGLALCAERGPARGRRPGRCTGLGLRLRRADFDWVWDDLNKSTATLLTCDNRKVNFHMEYSCGTAAIRGNKELADGQHFWEIKMTSPVYGTDMMVGIGTSDVNLDKYRHTFCSLLGKDEDSWGLSYTGLLHHKGDKTNFSSRFGQGSIIGVHLDTWHGTLTFFKNRKCIGVAATKLQNKKFYPMVCSTAAKSSMKVIRSCASCTSLQYLCCFRLRQLLPDYVDTLEVLPLPPGLKQVLHNKLGWVLSMNYSTSKPSSSSSSGSDSDSSCSSDAEACQRKRCRRT
ncbi:SPRY domain-containing SOCS box protein 3 isoform X5 [Corvus kubaryi]|uniref:SPRY domain-containing SOCS box protein 3 isoform X5 n=1 Tax=Corvus kubaryi TaxID=68294 RepID=UPI001C05C2EB|nr:SPRY domain-containing SOCS box protein 3 isoform X5 [Corvus kubaryi]